MPAHGNSNTLTPLWSNGTVPSVPRPTDASEERDMPRTMRSVVAPNHNQEVTLWNLSRLP